MPDMEEEKTFHQAGNHSEPHGENEYVPAGGIVLGSTVKSQTHMEEQIEGSSARPERFN
jgi:hypothetical protein